MKKKYEDYDYVVLKYHDYDNIVVELAELLTPSPKSIKAKIVPKLCHIAYIEKGKRILFDNVDSCLGIIIPVRKKENKKYKDIDGYIVIHIGMHDMEEKNATHVIALQYKDIFEALGNDKFPLDMECYGDTWWLQNKTIDDERDALFDLHMRLENLSDPDDDFPGWPNTENLISNYKASDICIDKAGNISVKIIDKALKPSTTTLIQIEDEDTNFTSFPFPSSITNADEEKHIDEVNKDNCIKKKISLELSTTELATNDIIDEIIDEINKEDTSSCGIIKKRSYGDNIMKQMLFPKSLSMKEKNTEKDITLLNNLSLTVI